MTYVPTNWQTGDVITAEKLNHAESAIGVYYFHFTVEQLPGPNVDFEPHLTESVSDIIAAFNAGKVIYGLNVISAENINVIYSLSNTHIYDNETTLRFTSWDVTDDLSGAIQTTINTLQITDYGSETSCEFTTETLKAVKYSSEPAPI